MSFGRSLCAAGLCALLAAAPPLGAQIADRAALVAALDSAARAHAEDTLVAGISVAVVRGADTLLMRGYGFADLEWDVPTPLHGDGSYEIGSMTKQFTAAAVMQLVEEGKLDLSADVTTYLPDFDTQGHALPLARLLDHTSGIKGYTEMPVFGEIMRDRFARDSLVTLIEMEPFEFEPGTAQIYNNSAFFLLGLIIEKVSGLDYAEYVRQRLFEPAGMDASYYCSESAVRKQRTHGYDAAQGGLRRKAYLDHTWPYAAGSLCSTVGDLVAWNRALHHGGVLSPDAYRKLTTPVPLVDGTPIRYAMGLGVSGEGTHRLLSHGGGINGFLSDGRYYPESDLVIVALQNTAGPRGPGQLTAALARLVLGAPPERAVTPFDGDLGELLGSYTGPARGRPLTIMVSREGDELVLTPRGAREGQRPPHLEGLTWGEGGTTVTFVRREGRIVELLMAQGAGLYRLAREEG